MTDKIQQWRVHELEGGWRQIITEENGDLVCVVFAGPVNVGEFGPHPVDAARETARLISAAPQMHEALRQIVWKLNRDEASSEDETNHPAKIDRNDAVIKMAVEALASADGT
jgi:hypothetical protein